MGKTEKLVIVPRDIRAMPAQIYRQLRRIVQLQPGRRLPERVTFDEKLLLLANLDILSIAFVESCIDFVQRSRRHLVGKQQVRMLRKQGVEHLEKLEMLEPLHDALVSQVCKLIIKARIKGQSSEEQPQEPKGS